MTLEAFTFSSLVRKPRYSDMTTPLEPFGYFRCNMEGWEDCAETDEGAKALYEITPDQALAALGWFSRLEIAQARIAELEEAIAAVTPATASVCTWEYHDDPDRAYWKGSCGIAWMFSDGGPKENKVNFCPRCGRSASVSDKQKDAI